MAYQSGDIIRASDFNSFRSSVLEIYGTGNGDRGYGQFSPSIPSKSSGDLISENEWTSLRSVIDTIADHQGTDKNLLPPSSELSTGEIIEAHERDAPSNDSFDFQDIINNIDDNRLNTDGGASMSLKPNVHSNSRSGSWSNNISATIRAEFNNEDEARFFFNSGGEIRLSLNHPNGNSPQDNNWRDVVNDIGVIRFSARNTTSTGSRGSTNNIGFYDLGSSNSVIFDGTNIGTGSYSSNDVYVRARVINVAGVNGGNGDSVEFEIELSDQHTNNFFDTVSGGTNVDFDIFVADVVLSGIPEPNWSTINGL